MRIHRNGEAVLTVVVYLFSPVILFIFSAVILNYLNVRIGIANGCIISCGYDDILEVFIMLNFQEFI